jgi:hypothetical protein
LDFNDGFNSCHALDLGDGEEKMTQYHCFSITFSLLFNAFNLVSNRTKASIYGIPRLIENSFIKGQSNQMKSPQLVIQSHGCITLGSSH